MEEFRFTGQGVITEKTVKEILADAAKAHLTESQRQTRLNDLKIRLEDWLSALQARNKGPSLMEMGLIFKDIETQLESIKKDDQG